MIPLFVAALFLSAVLLFAVQPMFAKSILPLLGGAPAVWNTCVLFFQTALLGGYVYAHAMATRLRPTRQAAVHLLLMAAALAWLPVALPTASSAPVGDNPVGWLLGALLALVGLPFFVLSASAPLLQRWFARTGHGLARDPYFLYAASNAGSFVGLLAYPLAIEPMLRLRDQAQLWAWGYLAAALLTAGCGAVLWRSRIAASGPHVASPVTASPDREAREPGARSRLRWLALALAPSSLMLSVTTYVSTDIAAFPLLWVVPLALYLSSFVVTFGARSPWLQRVVTLALPVAVLPPVASLAGGAVEPAAGLIAVHLAAFFIAALACHGELARSRPRSRDLTTFYFWIALGGWLGGVFNVLLAPSLFSGPTEYPVGLVAACLLCPAAVRRPRSDADPATPRASTILARRALDLGYPLLVGLSVAWLAAGVRALGFALGRSVELGIVLGLPLLLCALAWPRPLRFGLSLGAVLLAGRMYAQTDGRVVHAERTFFGVHRIVLSAGGQHRVLIDGRTIHGMQSTDARRPREPLSYYHRASPIAQVFDHLARTRNPARVAVLGLGAGSLAFYAQPGQRWTFYELNPAMARMASDRRFFTFLEDSAAPYDIVLGDGRLRLEQVANARYEVIVVDVFSSDAIPVHMLTREALAVYLGRLSPGGILAFHVSNRHVDLGPVLADLARDAGVAAMACADGGSSDRDWERGRYPSSWIAIARRPDDARNLMANPCWKSIEGRRVAPVWTDDFSNILAAVKWRER